GGCGGPEFIPAVRKHRRDGRASADNSWNRGMDGSIYCITSDSRNGCISSHRRRTASRRRVDGRREVNAGKPVEPARVIAAMARLRGPASVGCRWRECREPVTTHILKISRSFSTIRELSYHKGKIMSLAYKTINSPVGQLKLVASNTGLVAVLWERDKPTR